MRSCSSALPRLKESLVVQFQKALWACDGGDLNKDSTGVARRAWNLLDIICRILELAGRGYLRSFHIMRNLDVCRKIYSRARSSEQNDPSDLLAALRNVLHFIFTATNVSRDPSMLWYARWFLQGGSHSPDDFDWLVDYLDYIYSDDQEAVYDVLLLLGGMGVHCSPVKQHLFVERLVACMDSTMPPHLRDAALRASHSAREEMASIDAMDDTLRDMVLMKLSPAILSVVGPHPGTSANDDSDRLFDYDRDLCYLQLVFALARNSDWHPHLSEDRHIDRCISMIPGYCNSESPTDHAFYIAGIFLRITPEHQSVTLLDSVTEQQWWDVMRSAWIRCLDGILDTRDFELLPVLVDGTKKYMQIASKSDLEKLIGSVDEFLESLEREMQWKRQLQEMCLRTGPEMRSEMRSEMGLEMQPEMQSVEQIEEIAIAVKELRTAASNMLESFGQPLLIP
jgi:hypothetical protein